MSPWWWNADAYDNNSESGRRDPGWFHLNLSLHEHRTGLRLVIESSMLGMPRFPRIQSLPAGSPGTRQGWLHPVWVDETTSASSAIPRMAEADRIAEFKEVAVFLRRLETAAR